MGKLNRTTMLLMMRPDRRDGMESRFRDGRGREHCDNGRYAPMRSETNIEIEGRFRDDRDRERFPAVDFEPRSPRMRHDEDRGPMGDAYPMYRGRDGMRAGGYEMRPIGFSAAREWDGDRHRTDAGYEPRDEMAYRTSHRRGGYARGGEDWVEPLTSDKAERWVRGMRNATGAPGQHWTMDQTKQIMARHGYQDDPVEFYAAINLMWSDYVQAAQKVGCDKEDLYAALADAFLNDADARPDKLARYYAEIVDA